jgi:hypothetical protein
LIKTLTDFVMGALLFGVGRSLCGNSIQPPLDIKAGGVRRPLTLNDKVFATFN